MNGIKTLLQMTKREYFLPINQMKYILISIVFISQCFMQVRLSVDSDFSYENQDIDSGLSLSYDKVLVKKGNVNFGVGLEHMLSRDVDESTFKSNNLYLFIRNIYAKKWRSYLRLGYNRISGINSNDRNGAVCAFGIDYKLTENWHIETGYHITSTNEEYASRIVCSISRYFKAKDDK